MRLWGVQVHTEDARGLGGVEESLDVRSQVCHSLQHMRTSRQCPRHLRGDEVSFYSRYGAPGYQMLRRVQTTGRKVNSGLRSCFAGSAKVDSGSYAPGYVGRNRRVRLGQGMAFVRDIPEPRVSKDEYCAACGGDSRFSASWPHAKVGRMMRRHRPRQWSPSIYTNVSRPLPRAGRPDPTVCRSEMK